MPNREWSRPKQAKVHARIAAAGIDIIDVEGHLTHGLYSVRQRAYYDHRHHGPAAAAELGAATMVALAKA